MRVLLVEDEEAIAEPLADALAREGFDVTWVATAAEALAAAEHDLVLLDLRLPDRDGYEVCRELRGRSSVPIIVISARGEEVDRVVGLELGADDYLVKPFGFRELLARINAVTRRTGARDPAATILRAGSLTVDTEARRVTLAGAQVELTAKEFDLLAALAARPGAVVSRQRLLDDVWDARHHLGDQDDRRPRCRAAAQAGRPRLDPDGAGSRLPPARSMTRRLVATYIALALVVLLALAIPLGIELARSERRALASSVERDAFAFASLVEDRVPPRDPADLAALRSLARAYARDSGTRVVVVGVDGKALVDTTSSGPAERSFASRPEIAAALSAGRAGRAAVADAAGDAALRGRADRIGRKGARRGARELPDGDGRCADAARGRRWGRSRASCC